MSSSHDGPPPKGTKKLGTQGSLRSSQGSIRNGSFGANDDPRASITSNSSQRASIKSAKNQFTMGRWADFNVSEDGTGRALDVDPSLPSSWSAFSLSATDHSKSPATIVASSKPTTPADRNTLRAPDRRSNRERRLDRDQARGYHDGERFGGSSHHGHGGGDRDGRRGDKGGYDDRKGGYDDRKGSGKGRKGDYDDRRDGRRGKSHEVGSGKGHHAVTDYARDKGGGRSGKDSGKGRKGGKGNRNDDGPDDLYALMMQGFGSSPGGKSGKSGKSGPKGVGLGDYDRSYDNKDRRGKGGRELPAMTAEEDRRERRGGKGRRDDSGKGSSGKNNQNQHHQISRPTETKAPVTDPWGDVADAWASAAKPRDKPKRPQAMSPKNPPPPPDDGGRGAKALHQNQPPPPPAQAANPNAPPPPPEAANPNAPPPPPVSLSPNPRHSKDSNWGGKGSSPNSKWGDSWGSGWDKGDWDSWGRDSSWNDGGRRGSWDKQNRNSLDQSPAPPTFGSPHMPSDESRFTMNLSPAPTPSKGGRSPDGPHRNDTKGSGKGGKKTTTHRVNTDSPWERGVDIDEEKKSGGYQKKVEVDWGGAWKSSKAERVKIDVEKLEAQRKLAASKPIGGDSDDDFSPMEYPSSNPNAALSDIPERTEPDTSEVESSAAAHKTIDSVNTKHVDFDSGVHDYDGDEDTGRVKTDRRLSDAQHRRESEEFRRGSVGGLSAVSGTSVRSRGSKRSDAQRTGGKTANIIDFSQIDTTKLKVSSPGRSPDASPGGFQSADFQSAESSLYTAGQSPDRSPVSAMTGESPPASPNALGLLNQPVATPKSPGLLMTPTSPRLQDGDSRIGPSTIFSPRSANNKAKGGEKGLIASFGMMNVGPKSPKVSGPQGHFLNGNGAGGSGAQAHLRNPNGYKQEVKVQSGSTRLAQLAKDRQPSPGSGPPSPPPGKGNGAKGHDLSRGQGSGSRILGQQRPPGREDGKSKGKGSSEASDGRPRIDMGAASRFIKFHTNNKKVDDSAKPY